ncbi:MAG: glycerate kinase [Muribaculaceae bacterium]|nr:glycerate kinase [Muribaculaceae bacterium]
MKIVIAIDKFKGSASSWELAQAAAHGIERQGGSHEIVPVAVGDGGEGTVEAIAGSKSGHWCQCEVHAPLPWLPNIKARYFVDDEGCAYMETAAASGLALVPPSERNVMMSSSIGTGEMILHAVDNGCRKIVLCLGGSATCDGGTGMLAALGVEFFDCQQHHIVPCGEKLIEIAEIDTTGMPQSVLDTEFTLLCDVTAPLLGKEGAAHAFAPQKGASPEQVEQLEAGMKRYADFMSPSIAIAQGAGAAGGIGAAAFAFLGAKMDFGAHSVLRLLNFEDKLVGAQLVITGEGRIDATTMQGKLPAIVANMAHINGAKVVAIAGEITPNIDPLSIGFDAVFPINRCLTSLEEAQRSCLENVEFTVEQIMSILTMKM